MLRCHILDDEDQGRLHSVEIVVPDVEIMGRITSEPGKLMVLAVSERSAQWTPIRTRGYVV